MISRIFIIIGVITVVHGTFKRCPPFETLSVFKCGDSCFGKESCEVDLGCTCILGYKRKDGMCVPKRECCTGPNEKYCESGPDRTCDDVFARTIISHLPKNGRCCCKEGTVRDINGMCAPEIECYPKCTGKNEEYKTKGCDSNCNLKGVSPNECITRPGGCYCKEGFARQNVNDKDCIPVNECRCDGLNECFVFSEGCEKDCGGENCLDCPGRRGCYCKEGYFRDNRHKTPKCVLLEQCKKNCSSCGTNGYGDRNDE